MKPSPPPKPPKNEEEFLQLMEWVDAVLSSKGVAIHARPIIALAEVGSHYGISMPGGPLPDKPKPGSYCGKNLSLRMSRWFEKRYGERLLIDSSVGRSVILLRGAVWLMRIPRVYGSTKIACDPTIPRPDSMIALPGEDPPPLNVLNYVDRMTDDLKASLSGNERGSLMFRWLECYNAYYALDDLRGLKLPLIENSLYDFDASVDYLMSPRKPFGLAKWAALQATEKVLRHSSPIGRLR